MRRWTIRAMLAAFVLAGLAACGDESSILDPDSISEPSEIDVLVDQDLTDAILADAEAALAAVEGAPAGAAGGAALFVEPDPTKVSEARQLLEQARQKFLEARQAWLRGDTEMAAELAQEARELVAEALILVYGEEAYTTLLSRVDQVITWLEERGDDGTSELLDRIRELRAEAEALKDTDLVVATSKLIAALQIAHRERAHHRRMEMRQHARLSVFMAASAVQLAGEIAGGDATPEQVHALRHAQHLLQHANQALQAGRFRLAFGLGREAVNLGLVVAMLEPGIEQNRVEAMIQLSERAIAAAEEALAGRDSTSFAARLLEHAKELQARGLALADSRPRVAVVLLWHASVTAYGVINMVT